MKTFKYLSSLYQRPVFSRKFSVRRVLDALIETSYLAIIFLVPLWFAYFFPTYNIFEFNKMILFRVLLSALGFLTVVKFVFYSPHLQIAPWVFFKKYWLIPTIFIIGLTLTLFISADPLRSFYGSLERQAGLRSYLYYFLWFILLSFNILTLNNRRKEKLARPGENIRINIKRIIFIATLSGFVVAIYGILQILNIDFFTWPEPPFLMHRAVSSFGQPNFLASWLLLSVPLSFYSLIASRRSFSRIFFTIVAVTQLLTLFLTASRGGLLAFFVTAFLFLLFFLFFSVRTRLKKGLVLLSFLTFFIITLISLNYFLPERVSSLLDYKSGSVAIRANLYSAAAEAIAQRPVFGYGLEGGSEVFISYYEPDWAIHGDVGQSADRAHNLVLDTLLSTGFYGLILFLVLYYFVFSLGRENIRLGRGGWQGKKLSLAITFGLLAYLLSLLFSFTIVVGEVYFWLFLAVLVALNFSTESFNANEPVGGHLSETKPARKRSGGIVIKVIVVILLAIAIFFSLKRTFKELIADYYFNEIHANLSINLEEDDNFFALILIDDLYNLKINPFNQASYNISLASKLSDLYPVVSNPTLKDKIWVEMENLRASLPEQGYRSLLASARINIALSNFTAGDEYLAKIIEINPHWPLVYLEVGESATAVGDIERAITAYNLLVLNLPDVEDPRLNDPHRNLVRQYYYLAYYKIAKLFDQTGNWPAAEKYYRLAYGNNPFDFTVLKNIADTYYHRGDLKRAIEYNRHGLARNPSDYNWSLALASLYYESGNKERALYYLDQALELTDDQAGLLELKKEYEK